MKNKSPLATIAQSNLHKQRGITLVTSLIFLVIMSVVAMMASKLSIMDTHLARNNKEKVLIYQETANDLRLLADIEKLHGPMVEKKFDSKDGTYLPPKEILKPDTTEVITDIGFDKDNNLYDCEGWSGRASSIGLGARKCDLYDFQVTRQQKNMSGLKERHNIGMGKEVPSPSKYSNL